MNKLKSIIQYECMTSFKYIWIFYAIQYANKFFLLALSLSRPFAVIISMYQNVASTTKTY